MDTCFENILGDMYAYASTQFNIEMYINLYMIQCKYSLNDIVKCMGSFQWVKCYIESVYKNYSIIRNYSYYCLSCVNSWSKNT